MTEPTCERHSTGSGLCTCTLAEVQDRAGRAAALNAKDRNIARARRAVTPTDQPVKVKPGHTGPLALAALKEHTP